MILDCKVIEDLLPLYLDNVCSDTSKQLVGEHLKECEDCRRLINTTQVVGVPHFEPERPAVDNAVRKGLKRIRFRWWASILIVIIIVPMVFLGWNQYHGRGVHFTNIYELQIGNAFMKYLDEGNYEKAYSYIDIAGLKQEWLKRWFDEEKLKNIEADGLAKFCELGAKLEEHGGIQGYEYVGISHYGHDNDGTPIYQMIFKVNYAGKETLFDIMVSNDGIEYFSGNGSFETDPLAQFAIWSEYLWQDYEGCYYDPDLNEYVYPNK